jgi:hypothetical protein
MIIGPPECEEFDLTRRGAGLLFGDAIDAHSREADPDWRAMNDNSVWERN